MPLPADNATNSTKVFISYSHDSGDHCDNVCALANRLVESEGIDVKLDLWEPAPKQGWPNWMVKGLKASDFVLVVCTETYYQRAMGEAASGVGKGVKWESLLYSSHVYQNDSTNTKFIPIFLDDENINFIPDWLRSFTYYNLDKDTQYDDLCRHLTKQPAYVKPQLGKGRNLPPKTIANGGNKNDAAPTVDLSAMPTSSGIIVGRENEVEWLNKAWKTPKNRVVSIIAWGGVGKTSLINHWLNKMSENNFKGATRVFAHSFYSQGTSDQRNVSAEHFIGDAFKFLNYTGDMPESPHEKGLLLAQLFCEQRTLLVLDGLEPMQHPRVGLKGKLKDSALEVLIKQLAFNLDGLCVITSRVKVYELENRGEQLTLPRLNVAAGKQVLTNLGVTGPQQDMENAVNQVHGHGLTLSLLGGYLALACDGDIRRRDTIPNLVDEPEAGEHAKHVMHSYQIWLEQAERIAEVNLLFVIALFDRPVEITTVNALLASDAITGVTDKLKTLPAVKLKLAIGQLVKLQLITTSDNTLDCHPLVREHFANTLQSQNSEDYQQAHKTLYEYYKALPESELPDTLEQMQPLFNAISHGCKAGLYQQVLDEVYWPKIHQSGEDYINKKLGAFATNLTCIAHFFTDDAWAQPAAELTEHDQATMLNWAAFALRGLGRLQEALAPFVKGIDLSKKQQDWKGVAQDAGSASELYLTLGQVKKAVEYGELCVEYADQIEIGNGDEFQQMASRTAHADALLQRGLPNDITQANELFIEAEKRQQAWQPSYPYLYSLQGYGYCQLLLKQALNKQDVNKVIARVETIISWRQEGDSILDMALEDLTLGKAYLLINDLNQAHHYLDQAVNGLRKAGTLHRLPWALLTRATYCTKTSIHTKINHHQNAWQDLDETFEIATFGDMRLHLCDYHIEASRNIAAQLSVKGEDDNKKYLVIENGQTIHPTKTEMKERLDKHLKTAEQMINELPYHWRDDDLTEVKALAATKLTTPK